MEGATKSCCLLRFLLRSLFVKKTSICYFEKPRSNGVPGRVSGCPGPRQRVHISGNGGGHRSRLVQQAIAELRWEDGEEKEEKGEHHRQTHRSHHHSWRHFDGVVWIESVSGENTSFFAL